MKISLYACGHASGRQDASRAASAVVLVARGPDGSLRKRTLAYYLGHTTYNLASLQAVRVALASLHQSLYGRDDVTLDVRVDNHYCVTLLQRTDAGGFKIQPRANQAEVADLRDWFQKAGTPPVVLDKQTSALMAECAQAARRAAEIQANFDSGTLEVTDSEQGPDDAGAGDGETPA